MSRMVPHAFEICAQDTELRSTTIPAEHRPVLAHVLKKSKDALENLIHDMFDLKHWESSFTPTQYKAIHPSLQIATHLLEQQAVLDFFSNVLYADVKVAENNTTYLQRNPTCTQPLAHLAVQQVFTDLAHSQNLIWGFHKCSVHNEERAVHGMAFKSTKRFDDYCSLGRPTIQRFFKDPRIMINKNYLPMLEHATGPDLEIIQLSIASTILHELVHIVWGFRNGGDLYVTDDGVKWCGEPLYYRTSPQDDMGTVLEELIFGGVIEPENHKENVVAHINGGQVLSYEGWVRSRIIVPRWWIHMWFTDALYRPGMFEDLHTNGDLVVPLRGEAGFELQWDLEWEMWRLWKRGVRVGDYFEWKTCDNFLHW
ncbi:hypothetical protein CC86DRAFT_376851 [Ophiobolus disseminans]|uniref:Uncharacterized protein n=1 Tax=Ophiobolus disseminans TaxID=1469910 RepID=A0A6A7AKF2_9PLEO|nr:hypothetical protein CC86DRAFT_376851 [Ophiobolus disseminans]